MTLQRWMERIAEKEVERITAKCQRYQERQGYIPRWVEHGMGERFSRAEQLAHRVQMLLGIFSAKGVLPLDFKPAHSVGDLLTQHLDELEREAEHKGGVIQILADHFSCMYKVAAPLSNVAYPQASVQLPHRPPVSALCRNCALRRPMCSGA
jgi:hypothetical protein